MQSVDAIPYISEGNAVSRPRFDALYKPFWIFVIGSLAGFVFETIYCFIRKGVFEYRSSLIFVPFTAIYGLGAMVLYVGIRKINKTNTFLIFTFGLVVGTAIEYFCSLLQERLFGTISWDYSQSFMNLGGRVCLRLSAMWGLLAIVWAIAIEPLLEALIAKIPQKIYKPLTQAVFLFLMVNAVISFAAVMRWTNRLGGVNPAWTLSVAMDRLFPDEFMMKIFPNMRFPA